MRVVDLLMGLRTGEASSPAVEALWREGLVERLDLGALGRADTADLVTAILGADVR